MIFLGYRKAINTQAKVVSGPHTTSHISISQTTAMTWLGKV
jgi:hypothetical protein